MHVLLHFLHLFNWPSCLAVFEFVPWAYFMWIRSIVSVSNSLKQASQTLLYLGEEVSNTVSTLHHYLIVLDGFTMYTPQLSLVRNFLPCLVLLLDQIMFLTLMERWWHLWWVQGGPWSVEVCRYYVICHLTVLVGGSKITVNWKPAHNAIAGRVGGGWRPLFRPFVLIQVSGQPLRTIKLRAALATLKVFGLKKIYVLVLIFDTSLEVKLVVSQKKRK